MKSIPIALQGHLDQDATTWAFIVRVACKGRHAGTVLGFSGLDAPISYNDGQGLLTYQADNGGFMPERMQATADLNVDNTDLQGWISDTGITEAQIRAGLFDYADVTIYRVNYMDLGQGHEVVAHGTLGETKFSQNGWRSEFRSLTQQLKQPISKMYSLKCRARFGSVPLGTGDGNFEERHPCNKAFTWVAATVTAVDLAEPNRIFTASGMAQPDGHFDGGVIRVTSGDNQFAEMEVESFVGGVFTLSLPFPYNLAAGVTFEVRQDCDKTFGMCRDRHANTLNFRGEHLIPVADAGSSMIPGANI